jgi:ferredoxin-NADP reductase
VSDPRDFAPGEPRPEPAHDEPTPDVAAPDVAAPDESISRAEWQEAVIERIAYETPTVRGFVLRPRAWRPFLPGQHVDIRLTAPDGYRALRSYSVSSAPETRGTIELTIERLDDGEVSPYFHEVAQVGDTVELRGPFTEHFVWRSEGSGPVLLAGGGSGVAPLMSMVRHRAHVPNPAPMALVYSARTWADVIFREELLAQEGAQSGLRVVFCLTRDAAHRPGDYTRRIDAAILTDTMASLGGPPSLTFVCGANRFVETVADALVALGIPPSTIRTERYGGS